MKITVRRYFERTRQIADFVPIKASCEVSAECNLEDVDEVSGTLAERCELEVEKTLMHYHPSCVNCGGKQITPHKDLTKEGMCDECNKTLHPLKGRSNQSQSNGY